MVNLKLVFDNIALWMERNEMEMSFLQYWVQTGDQGKEKLKSFIFSKRRKIQVLFAKNFQQIC
jgi:hypothetical protein